MSFGFGMGFSRIVPVASGGGGSSGDPYWADVSLLLSETDTNTQTNNVFLDSSVNNYTITKIGAPTQGSFTPFVVAANTPYVPAVNGGNGYFDGGTSYLGFSATSLTGDFTIECWFYQTAKSSNYAPIISGTAGTYNFPLILDYQGSGKIGYYFPSTQNASTATSVFSMNTWNHLAVVRSGTSLTYYLNGASVLTASGVSTTVTVDTVGNWAGAGGYVFNGYISSARVVSGTAVYTSAFTPATQPLPAVQGANTYGVPSAAISSGTQLLLNFTNAGLYDATAELNLTTGGTAQVSSAQSKWAPTSLYLNGSSYVSAPASASLQFVGGDFTIEGWIYYTVASTQQLIIAQDDGASNGQAFQFFVTVSNTLGFTYFTSSGRASAVGVTTSNTVPLNTWSYVVVNRTGSTLKLYVDGVEGYSGTVPALFGGPVPTTLGAFTAGAYTTKFMGYMQDIRITKGVGRYPATCTVPTAAFSLY